MTAQGDAERRARMAQLLTDDMLAADAKAEWSHQLESWAGISMELGEVYVRDYEAPSALTGEPVATRMYAMASQRTACTPDDKQRSCVALWSLIEPNVEALTASARRALLEATPVAKRAEAVAALQNFKVDSKSRVLLVVDPKTLLPYSYQYEQWNQVPGEPSQYEILDEQLARE
jgi:hypothetical protein